MNTNNNATLKEASSNLLQLEEARWKNGEISESTYNKRVRSVNRVLDELGEETRVSEVSDRDLNRIQARNSYTPKTNRKDKRMAKRIVNGPSSDRINELLSNLEDQLQESLRTVQNVRETLANN